MGGKARTQYRCVPAIADVRQNDVPSPKEFMLIQSRTEFAQYFDVVETLDWGKTAPGPELPPEVLNRTGEKYREALEILTGV